MSLDIVSPSQVATFSRCPEQWRRRYLENEKIPPGIAAHVGGGVHAGAEINHVQKIDSGVDLPEGDVLDAARDGYVQRVERVGVYLTREERSAAERLLGEGQDRTVRLARAYCREVAPRLQPATVEQHLVIDPSELDGIAVQGYLDLTTTDDRIVDIKTSAKAWSPSRPDEEIQPTVYWRLYEATTGRAPRSFRYEVIVGTKKREYRQDDDFLTTTRDDSDWQAFLRRVQTMARMVRAGAFPPAPTGSWQCNPKWCGYYTTCPYQSRRVIMDIMGTQEG